MMSLNFTPVLLHVRDADRPVLVAGAERDGAVPRVARPRVDELLGRHLPDELVDLADDGREPLLQRVRGELELLDRPVDLVDEQDRLDLLAQRLAEHRLRLGHHALDGADHDDGPVDRAHRAGDVARRSRRGRACR